MSRISPRSRRSRYKFAKFKKVNTMSNLREILTEKTDTLKYDPTASKQPDLLTSSPYGLPDILDNCLEKKIFHLANTTNFHERKNHQY